MTFVDPCDTFYQLDSTHTHAHTRTHTLTHTHTHTHTHFYHLPKHTHTHTHTPPTIYPILCLFVLLVLYSTPIGCLALEYYVERKVLSAENLDRAVRDSLSLCLKYRLDYDLFTRCPALSIHSTSFPFSPLQQKARYNEVSKLHFDLWFDDLFVALK